MGRLSRARSYLTRRGVLIALISTSLSAPVLAQTGTTPTGPQTGKPQAPETAPASAPPTQIPGVVNQGPSREMKLGTDTWFRFAVQVQAWLQAHQDRLLTNAKDGLYGYDILCRRCRFFATGSVVKNVYFNFLFEAGNVGKADPLTGARGTNVPQVLDAYGQVKFTDAFWLSAGNILMPLTRNGTQPTTTYLSLDTANVAATPALQGNTFVLRDLGLQANGFFVDNHVEYRLGIFQGTRQPSFTGALSATGACVAPACTTNGASGHNGPRVVGSLMFDFWDPEVGYVNGGHYYGTKKVLGVMGNFDYQALRKDGQPAPGVDKNAYIGLSAAAFINYPLSGAPSRTGGDELAALLQFGYYDGGLTLSPTAAVTNPGSYGAILKQTNYLAEAAYYNHGGKFSIFGKFEKRKISDDYPLAFRQATPAGVSPSQTWIAGGLKYYIAPANLMNLTLQYERINNDDAPGTQQGGTNNFTLAYQVILY